MVSMEDGMSPQGPAEEPVDLERVIAKLERDFSASIPRALIEIVVREEERLAGHEVLDLSALAAERAARDRLRGLSGAPRRGRYHAATHRAAARRRAG
jgi:hypothetical protein